MRKKVTIFLCFLLITSCATTTGKRIDGTKIGEIKKGRTTRTEVISLFGNPENITNSADGTTVFTYSFASAGATPVSYIPVIGLFAGGMNIENESLLITFDENNTVKDYTYSKGKR